MFSLASPFLSPSPALLFIIPPSVAPAISLSLSTIPPSLLFFSRYDIIALPTFVMSFLPRFLLLALRFRPIFLLFVLSSLTFIFLLSFFLSFSFVNREIYLKYQGDIVSPKGILTALIKYLCHITIVPCIPRMSLAPCDLSTVYSTAPKCRVALAPHDLLVAQLQKYSRLDMEIEG